MKSFADLGKCSSATGEAYSMANLGDHLYISSYPPSLRLEEVLRDDEEGFRTAGPIVGDEILWRATIASWRSRSADGGD